MRAKWYWNKVPLGIKAIVSINIIVNLLLLMPLFGILIRIPPFFTRGLFVIVTNIILGIGLVLLKNWARKSFVVMQIVSLILSIWPFLVFLTLGLSSAGRFGDDYVPWAHPFTSLFWQQFSSFIFGMMFPTVPMLLSIFYIFYLTRRKVKEQFK